jgi:hypothetical protein
MEGEFRQIRMGSDLIRRHLADMLLVQLLRAFAERDEQGIDRRWPRRSWIGALTDPRLGAALDAFTQNLGEAGRLWRLPKSPACRAPPSQKLSMPRSGRLRSTTSPGGGCKSVKISFIKVWASLMSLKRSAMHRKVHSEQLSSASKVAPRK